MVRTIVDATAAHDNACGTAHRLSISERSAADRAELESFVRAAFAAKHGAHVESFMPTLLAMRGTRGQLCSVAGIRPAATGPLFLERYLAQPIEETLATATGRAVNRSEIVEVGNLAGSNCRAAARLILTLPRLLLARGQRWIVFTATDVVRTMLAAYDAPLLQLATAQAERVAGSGDDWGRYYERDPRVMAGFLPDGLGLRRRRGASDAG